MQKKFEVKDLSALPEILRFISQSLKELKLGAKEVNRSELMCEEALMKLIKHADFTEKKHVIVNVKKFLGDVSIDLRVPGNEFEFEFEGGISFDNDENDEETVEAIRNLVLRSFSTNIKYKHTKNFNVVKITAFRSPYSSLYKVLDALILALMAGFLMKIFMPEEIIATVNGNFLEPVHSLILNSLKMCAIPIMFFSIVLCFSQTSGGLSRTKHAGSKMFFYSVFIDFMAVFFGASIILMFGIGKGMNLTALSNSSISTAQNVSSFSIGDTIRSFIPDNFLKPFFEGNMLQLVILAVLSGVGMGAAGAKRIVYAFDEINKIFMKIMEFFLRFLPLLVFCSITSMVISTGAKTLFLVLGIFFAEIASDVLLLITYYLMIAFIARLNPSVMFKKSVPLMITAATTCSSTASIPEGMNTSQKLGISEKIYSFLFPLGTIICKSTLCLILSVVTLSTANIYGIELTLSKSFVICFYSILLPMTMPGIPGASIIILSSMLTFAGCPLEGVSIAVVIGPILDMIDTAIIVMGILVSTLIVAKSENQLDIEKYKS